MSKAEGYDFFFRRHQATAGTQEGKLNEMVGDIDNKMGALVEVSTRTLEQRSGMQTLSVPQDSSTFEAIESLRDDFRAVAVKNSQTGQITNEHLSGINDGIQQTGLAIQNGFESMGIKLDGLSGVISAESQSTRDAIVDVSRFTTAAIGTGFMHMGNQLDQLSGSIANEGKMNRKTQVECTKAIGNVLHRGFNDIGMNISRVDTRLSKMTTVFVEGLKAVDASTREGFIKTNENLQLIAEQIDQISFDGEETRETIRNAAEYTSEVFLRGLSVVGEKIDYGNYLDELALQEAKRTNAFLRFIGNEALATNENIARQIMSSSLQHAELLDALGLYDKKSELRHQELIQELIRTQNVLVGISDSVRFELRQNHQSLLNELSTKERWYFNKFQAAERERKIGNLDRAIQIYEAIVQPEECPQHYSSLIALVECYLQKGDYEKALVYAKSAQAQSPNNDLREYAEIAEVGIMYQTAEDTDEQDKYRKMLDYFHNTGDIKNFSQIKKLYYFACLYKSGKKEEAIEGLSALVQLERGAVLEMRNILLFEDFFQGDHLIFLQQNILENDTSLPGSVYFYVMNEFIAVDDINNARLALQKGIKYHPAEFMEKIIFKHPFVIKYLLQDLHRFVSENLESDYMAFDLVAYYYLVKKLGITAPAMLKNRLVLKLKNLRLLTEEELLSLSFILKEDFEDFIELYKKIKPIFGKL